MSAVLHLTATSVWAQLSCIWEATARKPGNVHRYQDFEDVTYLDFLLSAAVFAPALENARVFGAASSISNGIRWTRRLVGTNTNLGIVLLLAPLAAVPPTQPLGKGVIAILDGMDREASQQVFEAIRLANPAGLGKVESQDVAAEPTLPLREVMALAADRDLVARQYANGFREVFDEGVPALIRGLETTACLEGAIIFCHLSLMAAHPDSLIVRKRGIAEAEDSSRRARAVLDAGWPHTLASRDALTQLDDWLRAAGRGRNPGTTADLVTACIFVALREGIIDLPPGHPWTREDLFAIKNSTLPPPRRPSAGGDVS